MTTERKVSLGFLAGLVAMFAVGIAATFSGRELLRNSALLDHNYEVLRTIEDFHLRILEVESMSRGFALSGKEAYLEPYRDDSNILLEHLVLLAELTMDDPEQHERVARLDPATRTKLEFNDRLVKARRDGLAGQAESLMDSEEGRLLMLEIRGLIAEIEGEEREHLVERNEAAQRGGTRTLAAVLIGWSIAVALAAISGVSIQRDLRLRRQVQAALEQANAKLELANSQLDASNQQLESFSYSVSHDLRIPLRAIDGYSRMLLEDFAGALDEEGQRLLNVVRNSTTEMGRLIDALLAFSRAGRQPLALERIDMESLVRDAWEDVCGSLNSQLPRIVFHALPPARGDRSTVRQVAVNLLSNAAKFSSKNADARVEVEGRLDGGVNVYCVRDNGCGFDMKYAERLFNVFQRLHLKEEYEGSGVGLALVHSVILRHGGRVWAEGEVGKGAAFYFTLPPSE
ncbi:MAG: CHASE3 domain-containing protein [Candidatus Hydrogenedentes bacterium]|nr:CHASE3 domain-containing protein [Candidatus Hydrogenedentota bacterium]